MYDNWASDELVRRGEITLERADHLPRAAVTAIMTDVAALRLEIKSLIHNACNIKEIFPTECLLQLARCETVLQQAEYRGFF